jgi:hypothetical protein
LLGSAAGPDAFADCIATEFELLHERLVDDRDFRRSDVVGTGEIAPGQDRDTERPEVIRTDHVD